MAQIINFIPPAIKPACETKAPEPSDAAKDGTENLSAQAASPLRQRAVKYPQSSEPQQSSASQNVFLGSYILMNNPIKDICYLPCYINNILNNTYKILNNNCIINERFIKL